jgi:hypothetical protein
VPTGPHIQRLLAGLALAAAACGPAIVGGDGPPSVLRATSAARQTGLTGQLVASQPTVKVTDADGTPMKGVTVEFTVTAGGGEVSPASTVSGADGIATATWRLGEAGLQQVRATSPEIPGAAAVFEAQAYAASGYHVDLRLLTTATDTQWAAFTGAADRIAEVIVGGLPPMNVDGRRCAGNALSGEVAGLLVLVRLRAIDGPSGILGQAGPCVFRSSGFPSVGYMEFDTADLASLEEDGRLQSTILHEMLHVVGFGTLWEGFGLLADAGTTASAFLGAEALAAATGGNGADPAWTSVPVENCVGVPGTCGAGTRDSHWREAVFKNELMTGWLSGTSQPLSRTTVGSLADLGYVVDLDAADPFDLSTAALRAGDAEEPAALFLGDDILRLPAEYEE